MVIFIKKIFLIAYLIWRIYLTFRVFIMREKINLLCINLVGMLYVGGNEYSLIELDKVKTKFVSWPKMKKMLAINFYPLDCDELLSYTKQDYCWLRSLYLNYFEEPNIPPLKEELHVEENIILEDYVEV